MIILSHTSEIISNNKMTLIDPQFNNYVKRMRINWRKKDCEDMKKIFVLN